MAALEFCALVVLYKCVEAVIKGVYPNSAQDRLKASVSSLVPPSRLARVSEIGLSASLELTLAEGTCCA